MSIKTRYPEPRENEQNKERGSTTLKQCGWCEYATGRHRYNYCIEGKCSLQQSYSADVYWDGKCTFLDASKSDIEAFILSQQHRIGDATASIERCAAYISVMTCLAQSAAERPPLPSDRGCEHFNVNDPIAVWFENQWFFGKVRNGYRHHDGCVSYRLVDKGPQTSGFWGCGSATPGTMLKSEWEFFKSNPEEYDCWCARAYSGIYNGETFETAPIN